MACGAAYLSEHSVAVSMHAVAMQLISEVSEDVRALKKLS